MEATFREKDWDERMQQQIMEEKQQDTKKSLRRNGDTTRPTKVSKVKVKEESLSRVYLSKFCFLNN